jgi:hypothetical protein
MAMKGCVKLCILIPLSLHVSLYHAQRFNAITVSLTIITSTIPYSTYPDTTFECSIRAAVSIPLTNYERGGNTPRSYSS